MITRVDGKNYTVIEYTHSKRDDVCILASYHS